MSHIDTSACPSGDSTATARSRVPHLVVAGLVGSWFIVVSISVAHAVALVSGAVRGDTGRIGLDYAAFVDAGHLVASGMGSLLYEASSRTDPAVTGVPFVYPPWAAVLMVPWSHVPHWIGFAGWTMLGLALSVIGLRACGIRSWALIALVGASFPSVFALGLGQSAHLFVGVVALSIGAARRGSRITEGVGLALAGWKPHLLGFVGIEWASSTRRTGRSVVSLLLATSTLMLISAFILPGSWGDWVAYLLDSGPGLGAPYIEASLPGAITLATGVSRGTSVLVVAALAVCAIPWAIQVLRRSDAEPEIKLAMSMGVWLLVVPHVVVYDALILAIPLGMALNTRFRVDAIVAGTVLALGMSTGPIVSQLMAARFGWAIDVAAVSLVGATALAAHGVLGSQPLWSVDDSSSTVGHSVGAHIH